jgi:epsilon-lactone hydrolase
MLSPAAQRIRDELRAARDAPEPSIPDGRAAWELEAARGLMPAGTSVEPIDINGMPCELVRIGPAIGSGAILLLHGGGYVSGSLNTHRLQAARWSGTTGLDVLVVGYRLAPEHQFPAAVEDSVAAARWLADRYPLHRIVVIGDSAGGGLAVATLLALRDAGDHMPAGAVLLSPWLDLEVRGVNVDLLSHEDPSVTSHGLRIAGIEYAGPDHLRHPYASPIHADLSGLPPMYCSVGSVEILLDDAERITANARAVGVDVELVVGDGLWHVYPAWVDVPESIEALDSITAWIAERFTNLDGRAGTRWSPR